MEEKYIVWVEQSEKIRTDERFNIYKNDRKRKTMQAMWMEDRGRKCMRTKKKKQENVYKGICGGREKKHMDYNEWKEKGKYVLRMKEKRKMCTKNGRKGKTYAKDEGKEENMYQEWKKKENTYNSHRKKRKKKYVANGGGKRENIKG